MNGYTNFEQAAQALCKAGRELYGQGWTPATSSNFSARVGRDRLAITVSGKHKGELSITDIMPLSLSGVALSDQTPSAETGLHLQLYQQDPTIAVVLHTHSLAATLASMRESSSSIAFEGLELLKAFSGVRTHEVRLTLPIFPNTQNIPDLVSQVEEWFAHRTASLPAYLIRGHGLYTWGNSMSDAMRHLEALEFLLNYHLQSQK